MSRFCLSVYGRCRNYVVTLQAVKTVTKTMTDENDYDEDNHEEGLIVFYWSGDSRRELNIGIVIKLIKIKALVVHKNGK